MRMDQVSSSIFCCEGYVVKIDAVRKYAMVLYPDFLERLQWGGKVVGLRVALAGAKAAAVKSLVSTAYERAMRKGEGRKRRDT